jgi:hypothetical protein
LLHWMEHTVRVSAQLLHCSMGSCAPLATVASKRANYGVIIDEFRYGNES